MTRFSEHLKTHVLTDGLENIHNTMLKFFARPMKNNPNICSSGCNVSAAQSLVGPRCNKTCLRGFRQSQTQTSLPWLSYRD